MRGVALMVLVFSLFSQCVALAQTSNEFTAAGRCTNVQVCTYKYVSHQSQFDGEEQQDVDFSADVKLSCQSVGTFGSQSATHYCIQVQNVQLSSDILQSNNSEAVSDTEPEERIEELQQFINHSVEDAGDGTARLKPEGDDLNDQLFAKGFCFIQTADGLIADVIYPKGENTQVANIKKSIASAFQANFQNKGAREEADVSGVARARYRIMSNPTEALAYTRTVSSADVRMLAGVPSDLKVTNYNKEDRVSFDANKIVQQAEGRLQFSFASLSSINTSAPTHKTAPLSVASRRIIGSAPAENRHTCSFTASSAATPDPDSATFDESVGLDQELSASGTYTLTKVECSTLRSIISNLGKRAARSADMPREEDMSGMVRDSIQAKIDQVAIDKSTMGRLRRSLPSISDALLQLHRDPEQYKTANNLHHLLSLEAEHGPLPGHSPAIEQVLAYLVKIQHKDAEKDVAMRQLLYSMLVTQGDQEAQKTLVDIFSHMRRGGGESPELTSLITYLAFLRNASNDTADRLHSLVKDNNDSLLLTLGSLAKYAPKDVQEQIVAKLAARLEDKQDSGAVILLLHSLGNTGSRAAVRVLLQYLKEKDLDVQMAAVSSLRMHLSSEEVQKALVELLEETNQEEIVESVVQMLLSAIRDHAQHPESEADSAPLSTALVVAALKSTNPKLHNMVVLYLESVGTEHAVDLISVLLNLAESDPSLDQFEYDIGREASNSSETGRHRRDSDWDEYNPDYDIVASYSSRTSDVLSYPQHKAYIWGKTFGVSKVYAHFGAGGFVGAANNGQQYKIFAKAVAKGHAFGRTATAVHAEYLRTRSYSTVYQKIYVKIVGNVLENSAGNVPLDCIEETYNLYQSNGLTLLDFSASVFIYAGTLDFYVKVFAKLRVDVHFCACEEYYTACATLTPTITLQPAIGASATIIELVRVGIEVSGNFEYRIEPELCIKVDFSPSVKVTPCISVYHSWPNSYVEIDTYYQIRKFKLRWPPWNRYWYWSSKRSLSALSKRWTLPSTGRRLLWSRCKGSIVCDPNLTPTTSTTPTTMPTIWTFTMPTFSHITLDCPLCIQNRYVRLWVSQSYFKLRCPAGVHSLCSWFHEEWSIPRYYMWSSRIDETGSLYLRATTDNSGTWRVKYGQCETVYHVTVIPKTYMDFSEEFGVASGYQFSDYTFEHRRFENNFLCNSFVRNSNFRDVSFRNMYFQDTRFENVTFENVIFEWTEDWYVRAKFVKCIFINTVFVGAHFRHTSFERCRFEGGVRCNGADQMYEERLYTFYNVYMYDTDFSHVDWFDTFWYRVQAYNTTFKYNRWRKFEAFETSFFSYYPTKVPCWEIMYGDFVYDWEYFSEEECYAYLYRYAVDYYFDFDEHFYRGVGNVTWWYPSVRFYNCQFDHFTFRRTQMRAVEWIYTDFYNGTFYGDYNEYFYDHHFARCRFTDIDFTGIYFRGFTFFTGCHFNRCYFKGMTGDRVYFYGSYYYHFYMHFITSHFMYFDHGHWEHGYIRGCYDFFRFENMVYTHFRWEVDRADTFEYCHVYYDHFTIATTNVGEFTNICNYQHYHKRELQRQFCFDYPYYYQCMHFKLHHYDRLYHKCDLENDRSYYDSFYQSHGPYTYDRSHDYDKLDHYDRTGRFYQPSYDVVYGRGCHDRMFESYTRTAVVMRNVDFQLIGEYFFNMPSTYRFYYDGVYESRYFWDYYWKIGETFEREYYCFDSFFHYFQ